MCLIGGVLGVLLAFGISFLISRLARNYHDFSVGSIVAAFSVSTLIGVTFGFLPARNAARLDPVDALARE